MPRNLGDPQQVRESDKEKKLRHDNELNDMRAVLALPAGRRMLWRYLSECRVFSDGWDPSAKIHFNAGQRNIGLRILADITEASDESYLLMQREAKRREAEKYGSENQSAAGNTEGGRSEQP